MRKQRYFPSRSADQVRWLTHFRAKLPEYAEPLTLTVKELAEVRADAGWAAYLLGPWQGAARVFPKAATSGLRHGLHGKGATTLPHFAPPEPPEGVVPRPAGALDRVFAFVAILKYRKGMTDSIARDLGLQTLSTGAKPATPRFLIRLEYGPDGNPVVLLTFWKHGHEGVAIETRRGDGPVATFSPVVVSPARDTRPLLIPGQPELRHYRMRFWHKGDATGEWTSWRQIAAGPA